ncbi:MAG: GGDEF domain-containing protein [Spirochaetes bacterium]|nr:GGDEF domain-containing protein [Spirochaetota bacterium]
MNENNFSNLTANNALWTFNIDSGIKHVLHDLSQKINISRAIVYIYDENNNILDARFVYINRLILIGDEQIDLSPSNQSERVECVRKKKDCIKPFYIHIPLYIENRLYGLVSVDKSLDKNRLTKKEISLIKKMANLICYGIYQNKILVERDNRIKQLNELLNISMLLNSNDIKAITKHIGKVLIQFGKFDRARIFIKKTHETYICEVSESIAKRIDVRPQKYYNTSFFDHKEISDIYQLMILGDRKDPLGFIEVDNIISQIKIEEEQANFLKIIAGQLAITLSNINLLDQVKKASITDPLTKTYNYRYLMEYLEQEVNRAKRINNKFSIIIVDVDDFKMINDKYGHIKGDVVLKMLTKEVKTVIRKMDILARYGGDEFLVVAPKADKENASKLAHRILKASPDILFEKNKREKLRLSIGLATFPDDGPNLISLFKAADKRLYKAKQCGKNQVYDQD